MSPLKSELENRIQMLLGGRTAEILTYADASSGAASDLKEASKIALTMVANLGLGDQGALFNLEALAALNVPPDTSKAVAEAEALLATQNARCFALLRDYDAALKELTSKLLARETIEGSEVVQAVADVRMRLEAAGADRRSANSAMRVPHPARLAQDITCASEACDDAPQIFLSATQQSA